MTSEDGTGGSMETYDVIVIGAGVSGMYALHRLREAGLSVRVYDGASDIGGTWWYNRYPGARVDGPGSPFYGYTFSNELMEWDWAETQSEQSAVLEHLEHVADRFDLRRDIQFETWVEDARYDDVAQRWTVETTTGVSATAEFLLCAVGALSTPNMPDIPGIDDFAGEVHHTGRWPHEPVSFRGKRVAVIGTGSSGIQSIPEIAREAEHVTVLQRTAQYTFPAGNRPITPEEMAAARENFGALRELMHANGGGFPFPSREPRSALDDTPEERRARYEALWQRGGFKFFLELYSDIAVNEEANATLADFVRDKIREIVHDPVTAEKLLPEYFVMTKRPILDDGYYETFNRDNVTLVDLRKDPIERFTATSVVTASGEHPIDLLVLATGFDAISGSMLRLNPKGRGGLSLKDRWNDRFHNYLGLSIAGLPNLFMIHGPGSPGVFYNMPLGAERQVNWIADLVRFMREHRLGAAEPLPDSEAAWGAEVSAIADATLFPRTDSWWTGANIPGKPRYFSAYLGGTLYYQRLAEASAEDYAGFAFEPAVRPEDAEAPSHLPSPNERPAMSDRPSVDGPEPIYTQVDDIEWTPVQRQRNADGSESVVRERWPIMRPDFLSAYVHYEPGMVVRRHGHRSNHVVFLLDGGAWLGDRWCTPGTHVHVPLGAAFGPIIAGPEGATFWELSFGEFGGWGDEPELYEREIAARGVTPLPDPPLELADWFVDPRGDTGAVRPTPRVPGLDEAITHVDELGREDAGPGITASWPVRLPDFSSAHVRFAPGATAPRHGHRGRHVALVVSGGAHFGERWCPTGTHVELPEGAAYGPIVAGDEGMEILGLTDGPAGTWSD